jgi:hypothetical protein
VLTMRCLFSFADGNDETFWIVCNGDIPMGKCVNLTFGWTEEGMGHEQNKVV